MRVYILGIGGTLMVGIATLAKQLGFEVRGCDRALYPPMDQQLEDLNITVDTDYLPEHLDWQPDQVIVGNSLTSDSAIFTALKQSGVEYLSGADWLAKYVLASRKVVAITGTHGKTTTCALLTHLLRHIEIDCGYLVAGIPGNFASTADLGSDSVFVLEADEYDTACFDKQAKFMHYKPDVLLVNNLEFDHADIYADLNALQTTFEKLLQSLADSSCVVVPDAEFSLAGKHDHELFYKNCNWQVAAVNSDSSEFALSYKNTRLGIVRWVLAGEHNLDNLRAALCVLEVVAADITKQFAQIVDAIKCFKSVARRLQDYGEHNSIRVVDDFAHHPTAIAKTIAAVKAKFPDRRLVACVEFASYSMRSGAHNAVLPQTFNAADKLILIESSSLKFALNDLLLQLPSHSCVIAPGDSKALLANLNAGDVLLFMSNRDLFELRHAVVE